MNNRHMFKTVGVKEILVINHTWIQVMEIVGVKDKADYRVYLGIIMI
jgi:hypothetical protein